jgi:hypothetical protein
MPDIASHSSFPVAIGDVISVKGRSIPAGWDAYYFKVIGFQDNWTTIHLDGPYVDPDCITLVMTTVLDRLQAETSSNA